MVQKSNSKLSTKRERTRDATNLDYRILLKLETARQTPYETRNAILLRLLDLINDDTQVDGLYLDEVFLPNGTTLKMNSVDQTVLGSITGGMIRIGSASFTSISAAARHVLKLTTGKAHAINGWTRMYALIDGEPDFERLDKIRDRLSNKTRKRTRI